ncbi:FmtB protein [Streptococcus mitis]|uniref:FmtB protein n=1 Tax=Streptococcus mitis TaxID=28037 RepID=A0A139PZW1_STRMT|nr:FmtB protein [Streptococcus mitis]
MGIYQPSNAQQYAHVETVKLPVLYKLNEAFEPKVPERTEVTNPTKLTDEEVNAIKDKIWAVNQDNNSNLLTTNNAFKDNVEGGKNSIVIDKTTGTATITYKDGTADTIEGSKLIYKKPEPETETPKPVTPSTPTTDTVAADGLVTRDNGIKFYTDPVEVDDLDNIQVSDRTKALNQFLKANLTDAGYNEYDGAVPKNNLKPNVSFNLEDNRKATINFKTDGGKRQDFLTIDQERPFKTLGIVPKVYLFKEKAKPKFDVDAARAEANKLIDSLDNLYPKEKTDFKNEIAKKSTRADIEAVVKNATDKATENAVKLAEMKKGANDKINALNYLTKEEKDGAIKKINSATIKQGDADVDTAATPTKTDTDDNRDATQARLNSVVAGFVETNLRKAKEKATETINNIPDEDLSTAKKDEYKEQIKKATEVGPASTDGTILNIVDKAQKEASDALAKRTKDEADRLREQYKNEIDNIPGLTEEERNEYKKEIGNAPSVGAMESIVNFAKLAGERKKAISEIDNLQYLNNKQKQSFRELIDSSGSKEDIEDYVSQAKQLNSKMKQLQDLATEARKIKPKDGTPAEKYTSADSTKQQAFDTALGNAESVLDKANGADEAISNVEHLFTALETAINELKPGEKVTIPVDKDALKAEYDKGNSVKNLPVYTNEKDNTKKQAYDTALVEAKKILDKTDATQDQVNKALETLVEAKAGLNGKEAEFTLGKVDDKAVPISVAPSAGTVVSTEDQKLIKAKITGIPNGATVICKPIVEESGKKYVPVTVTHENVSKDIQIEVVQSEASKTTPTVTNGSVAISVDPETTTNVTDPNDQDAIKNAVTVPDSEPQPTNKEILNDGRIETGTGDNANKKVVKVKVTYSDGSSENIEVPVEGTDAAKATPTVTNGSVAISVDPETTTNVTDPNDQDAIKNAVTVPDSEPQPTKKEILNDGRIETGTGDNANKKVVKVKVTYNDGSSENIEVPVEGTDAAKSPLNPPTTKVKVDNPKGLTEKEKTAVENAVKEANPSLKTNTKIKVTVDNTGKVTVTYSDNSHNELTADKTVEPKTKAEKATEAKAELEEVAKKEKEDIKADNSLDDSEKEELNKKVEKAKNDAIDNIDAKTTVKDIEDAKQKGEQAIKAVHQSELDKKKAEAKKELETAAEAEKKEIESDLTLDPDTKVQKKKEVDKVKETAEKAVEAADTSDEVTAATNDGKQAIAAVHTVDIDKVKDKAKANLTEAAEAEKKEIDADNGLTESEKDALKQKVDKVKEAQEDNITQATTAEDIAKATTAGKQAIAGVHTPTDIKDKSKKLNAPQEKVKVKDLNHLTDPEKAAVKAAVKNANPNLSDDDITVDDKGNVTSPKGYLSPKDVIVPALNKPTAPVTVTDPNHLTTDEQKEVQKAVSEANKDSNLAPDDVHVDDKGNVKTNNNGNLPAGDVVTQKLKKPAKPVEVVNPKKLTDTEKEEVKTAIVEANKDANGNPTVAREQVTVDDDGSVTTPIGKLDSGDVVKAKTDTTPTDENTDPAVTLKGEDLVSDLPELSVQNALVAGVVTVEKGQPLTDEDIKKQLVLTEDMVVNSIKKPSTTETGNKEAEVEITLADGSKVTVKVPVVVVESLENANPGNNLAEAKEEAKKHVEEAANAKNDEINKRTDLSDDEKKAATDKVNKAKDDANTQIDNATSSGTAKAIGAAAAENIQNFNPKPNNPAEDVKPVDTSKLDELDEEKAKAIAEIEQAAKDQINAINNNKGLTSSQKAEAIKTIEELKAKAIEDVRKATIVKEVQDIVNTVVGEIKAVNPQPYSGYSYGDDIHSSSDAQANAEALANAKESAKNAIEKAAKDKQDEIKDASLSDKEQAELLAKVEAEKESALKAIETAKTVEDVKEAETIGLQAIASVTIPKKPVAPNAAAPQATSAPQATAGTMQDVTYQSPAGKQLPNTGSASSAALASLGLVAATSGFALLGRKARRRK